VEESLIPHALKSRNHKISVSYFFPTFPNQNMSEDHNSSPNKLLVQHIQSHFKKKKDINTVLVLKLHIKSSVA